MIYRVAYCDDDSAAGQAFARKIASAFERRGSGCSVTFFSSARALEECIGAGTCFDALILDIDMPELNGIALSRRLRAKGLQCAIVFLSNREEMVYQSLQVQPIRFLRKSRFAAEIGETVEALIRHIDAAPQETVLLQSGKELYRLPLRELLYMEITNQTLSVCLRRERLEVKYRLSDAERAVAGRGFLRIHKSYLVNCRAIFRIRKDAVVLDNGETLPLSRHRYTQVMEAFLRWTRKEIAGGVEHDL